MEAQETSRLRAGIGHMKEEAAQLGEKLKERVTVYKEGASELLDSASEYIKEHPQKSAMIALGVGVGLGVIVGLLLRGRRD